MRIATLQGDLDTFKRHKAALEQLGHEMVRYVDGVGLLHGLLQQTFDLILVDPHPSPASWFEEVNWVRANLAVPMPLTLLTMLTDELDIVRLCQQVLAPRDVPARSDIAPSNAGDDAMPLIALDPDCGSGSVAATDVQ